MTEPQVDEQRVHAAHAAHARDPRERPRLTFAGGGWVIATAVALVGLLLLWAFWGVLRGEHPVGDGSTVGSYGFVLEPQKADKEFLVGSGQPRDFLTPLNSPSVLRGTEMLEYNKNERRVYVATTDRVAGVVVGGEARAYPLAVLNAHEIVNDTLGGVPIAVTYSPLTDSVAVFERRIPGGNGPVRIFKVSGLLYNSNLVMYDAWPEQNGSSPPAPEMPQYTPSLWSQLEMRAIAGPAAAAGETLTPIPGVNIASWKMWLAAHPDTSVILPDPGHKQRYKEFNYARYMLSPHLNYPVHNLQPEAREAQTVQEALDAHTRGVVPTRKTPAVVVTAGGETSVWTLPELLNKTGGQDGEWKTTLGGVPLTVTVQREPMAAVVAAPGGEPVLIVPQLWFARQAFSR